MSNLLSTQWGSAMRLLSTAASQNVIDPIAEAIALNTGAAAINSPRREAHFLAHICYESGGFHAMVENLNYSAANIAKVFPKLAARALKLAHNPIALANAAYAGRYGNGDEASNDGYRFRGRGLLQHTFKSNYLALSKVLGIDLVANPDRLIDPEVAVKAALFYWSSHNCNVDADTDNIHGTTLKINGGLNGLDARTILKNKALVYFESLQP